jgi:uncharacterized membrane protein YsdA (DUF1294 family)
MAKPVLVFILALVALGVINAWTMLLFWLDKQRARAGGWRIPEANLLGLALIGGTPGALLARSMFRHKTRKQPFGTVLYFIVAVQVGTSIGLLFG